ncbi:MAG TPA: GDSL-type esterase/lipase family protein [Thermomicrobiaceae bacterium]|nr:GDSL-type esterase/lipase family protein [Thermomicrobiaceae bacterium]
MPFASITPFTNCPVSPAEQLQVCPLGDSITQGTNGGWKVPLFAAVKARRTNSDFVGYTPNALLTPPVTNCGTGSCGFPGSSAASWKAAGVATYVGVTPKPPDIFLVSLGTNDANNVQGGQDVGAVVDQIVVLAPKAIVLVATRPPQVANASTTINSEIKAQIALRRTRGYNVAIVDQFANMTTADLLEDGVHPTPTGYQKMGQLWIASLLPYVKP